MRTSERFYFLVTSLTARYRQIIIIISFGRFNNNKSCQHQSQATLKFTIHALCEMQTRCNTFCSRLIKNHVAVWKINKQYSRLWRVDVSYKPVLVCCVDLVTKTNLPVNVLDEHKNVVNIMTNPQCDASFQTSVDRSQSSVVSRSRGSSSLARV